MKRTQSSAVVLIALVVLLLAAATGPVLATGANRLSGPPTPPVSAPPAGLAANRIDPPDRGVCVTRLGRPCPWPPRRVQ